MQTISIGMSSNIHNYFNYLRTHSIAVGVHIILSYLSVDKVINVYRFQSHKKWKKPIFCYISAILTSFSIAFLCITRCVYHFWSLATSQPRCRKEEKERKKRKKEDSFLFIFCDRMSYMCSTQWWRKIFFLFSSSLFYYR